MSKQPCLPALRRVAMFMKKTLLQFGAANFIDDYVSRMEYLQPSLSFMIK
jgi:hypothetical protein